MNPKLPYYMAYPMPLAYDDEKIERRDFEYMKSLYPAAAKKVLPYIEDECDRMEFEHSMMYDEYPDKLQLHMMCSRIYNIVCKHERSLCAGMHEDESMQDMQEQQVHDRGQRPDERGHRPDERGHRPDERGHRPHDRRNDWLHDFIEVMLFQELFKRRSDHRRSRRRFY